MPAPVLYAVDSNDKEVLRELLSPLFAMLAPGFEANAQELRIEVTHAQRSDFKVTGRYVKGGVSFPLSIAENYHPWITSSRIRLLCGMSIMPDVPQQAGMMMVHLDECTVSVKVQVIAEKRREVMLFQPIWDNTAAKNENRCEV